MSVKLSMGAGGAYALAGYVSQVSKTVKTDQYINSVLAYTHARLARLFDMWMDNIARNAPHSFHHMYEWPHQFQDYRETVGNPANRLWSHTFTGHGRNKVASFRFRASVRPTPVDPILLEPGPSGRTVKTGVHVFVWKAMAMEYGIDIEVSPKMSRYLAYVYGVKLNEEKEGRDAGRAGHVESGDSGTGVQFSIGPVEFQAGTRGPDGTNFQFTSAFVHWWQTMAGSEFDGGIRQELESGLIDESLLTKAIRRGNRKNKEFSITAQASKYMADFEEAAAMAERAMKARQLEYWRQAKTRSDLKYGEDEE